MLLLDANVVLAAHRGDHPHHAVAAAERAAVVAGQLQFTVPLGGWLSVLHLVTDRRVFPEPSTVAEVVTFDRDFLRFDTVRPRILRPAT